MTRWTAVIALLGVLVAVPAAPMSKYHVTATVDKDTDFNALHTYMWTSCWGTFNEDLDTHIVSAIDRELASRGLTERLTPPSDVVVTFGTVLRTNVDWSAKRIGGKQGVYPEYPVGTLVVLIKEPNSRRELFRGRGTMLVDVEIEQLEEEIDAIVARMFEHYPTRT